MYSPYHEMDIRQIIDAVEQLVLSKDKDTKLKQRRKQLGLSQSGLAKVLYCRPENLMEEIK